VIQGVLFLFYEPELTDHFIPGEALYDMSTLQEAVDKTKYGGSTDGYYLREWITFQEFSPIYKGTIPQKTTEDEAEQPSQENGLDEVTVNLVSLGIDSGIEEEKTTDADTNVQEETISAVLDVPKLGFKKVGGYNEQETYTSKSTKIVLCVVGEHSSKNSCDQISNRNNTSGEAPDR